MRTAISIAITSVVTSLAAVACTQPVESSGSQESASTIVLPNTPATQCPSPNWAQQTFVNGVVVELPRPVPYLMWSCPKVTLNGAPLLSVRSDEQARGEKELYCLCGTADERLQMEYGPLWQAVTDPLRSFCNYIPPANATAQDVKNAVNAQIRNLGTSDLHYTSAPLDCISPSTGSCAVCSGPR